MIQAPKPEPRIMRYELSDYEWAAIKPMLPNKPRGVRRENNLRGGADDRYLGRARTPARSLYRGQQSSGYGSLARAPDHSRGRGHQAAGCWNSASDLPDVSKCFRV